MKAKASHSKIDIIRELQKELEDRKTIKNFFSEDFISIDIDILNQWIYANWKGYQTEPSVKMGCEKILEALSSVRFSKVLNDNTNVLGIWTPASAWVGKNWFPRMQSAGLKYFAWIYSPSAMSQLSTNETLKNTSTTEIIKTFYDIRSGTNWLTQQK